jgi:hypothetical protein
MIKKIINLIYGILTRIIITSSDKAVLERAWNNDYKPFGYKMIKLVKSGENWKLVVCKHLKNRF